MSKHSKKQTHAEPEATGPVPPPPAYFLSVTLENVRCVGEAQTLDLSDGNGRPAQWTVILGDNGTGKTTLLQAIAMLEPIKISMEYNSKETILVAPRWSAVEGMRFGWKVVRRGRGFEFSSEFFIGSKLCDKRSRGRPIEEFRAGIAAATPYLRGALSYDELGALDCYAYGASRHMAVTGLQEEQNADATASLFSDGIELPNAEEWLLQADYAAKRAAKKNKKRAEQQRDQIIDMLFDLLPACQSYSLCRA